MTSNKNSCHRDLCQLFSHLKHGKSSYDCLDVLNVESEQSMIDQNCDGH